MDQKGYYKTLGVKEDASLDEIKKKFKKLSLKYHPDRQVGKSEKEQKEAEAKFKEINEAYQVLSDETKRKNYDTFGDADGHGSGFSGGYSGGGPDLGDIFGAGSPFGNMADAFSDVFGGSFFGGSHRSQTSTRRQTPPGDDMQMKVPLTLEEVFNGCTKKFKYKRKVRCPNCHGAGGTGLKTCPHCHGTGMLYDTHRMGNSIYQQTMPCPHCKGTGQIVEHECPSCHGNKFKEEYQTIEVNFPAGMPENYAIEKHGMGHESADKNMPSGTLLIFASYAFDKNKYRIHNLDVYEKIELNYYDALLGCDYDLKIPNGTTKRVKIPECSQPGKVLKLAGQGIKTGTRTGDYYIEIVYKFPTSLSAKEKEALKMIKK